jgi:hypothetical protein
MAATAMGCSGASVAYRLEVREAVLHVRTSSASAVAYDRAVATSSAAESEDGTSQAGGEDPAPVSQRPRVAVEAMGENAWRFSSELGLDHTLQLDDGDFVWTLHNERPEPARVIGIEPYRARIDLERDGQLGLFRVQRLFVASLTDRFCGDGISHPAPFFPTMAVGAGEERRFRLSVPGRMKRPCTVDRPRGLLPSRLRKFERRVVERFEGEQLRVWLPARTEDLSSLLQVDLQVVAVEPVDASPGRARRPWLRRPPWELGGFSGFGIFFRDSPILYAAGGLRLNRLITAGRGFSLRIAGETSFEVGARRYTSWWNGLRLDPRVGADLRLGRRHGFAFGLPVTVSHGVGSIGCTSSDTSCTEIPLSADNLRVEVSPSFGHVWAGGSLSVVFSGFGFVAGSLGGPHGAWVFEVLGFNLDFTL